jgi:class 3 adenylate cyclase/adenylate kinase family enzyme
MYSEFNFDEEVNKVIQSLEKKMQVTGPAMLNEKTVLIADLVSAAAAKDEYGHTIGMNRCYQHNLMAAEVIKRYKGTVIKFIGDSVLAAFSSSYDAVLAAFVFRGALEKLKLPGEEFQEPMETRITLTVGTIEEFFTESGYDIGGQVVDKAARLQEVAAPGQILAEAGLIERIKLALQSRMPLIKIAQNEEINELQLKGFKERVKVVEITTQDKPFGPPPSDRGRYITRLVEAISSCNTRVWLSIRAMKSRKNRRDIGVLQDQLAEAQNRRGVDIRIMNNGGDAESLKTAAELDNLGITVRFSDGQVDSSINLVDNNIVIFSSKRKSRFFSKNKYWEMISYHVNSALAHDFQERWSEAIPARLQLAEILDRTFKNCGSKINHNEITDHIIDRFGIGKGTFLNGSMTLLGFTRKVRYIFVLGRPGTGKSTIREKLANRLESQLGAKTRQIDDYERLKAMFTADIDRERFIPQKGGGFMVKDPAVLTEVLENISLDCLSSNDNHITWLIEFARGEYMEAFASFDPKVLSKAVVVHSTCEKSQIYIRLKTRAQSGGASVSEEVIEKYYKKDDAAEVCKKKRIPYIEIDNNSTVNELNRKIEKTIHWLKDIANSIYVRPIINT